MRRLKSDAWEEKTSQTVTTSILFCEWNRGLSDNGGIAGDPGEDRSKDVIMNRRPALIGRGPWEACQKKGNEDKSLRKRKK